MGAPVLSVESVDVVSCIPVVVSCSPVVVSVVDVPTVELPELSPWVESCVLAVVLAPVSAGKSLPSDPTGVHASEASKPDDAQALARMAELENRGTTETPRAD